MKRITKSKINNNDEMLPEYDFTSKKGIRGKYYQAYRRGHTVRICQEDGSVNVKYFTLAEGSVMLEPDVRRYFPDSKTVNDALRSLIDLIPRKSSKHLRKSR
jgi:hypothetical protein